MQYKKFIVVALIGLSICQWSLESSQHSSVKEPLEKKLELANRGKKWLLEKLTDRLTALKAVTKLNTFSTKPPTHYLYLTNPKQFAPDTFKKKLSTDPFVNSFMQSARKGSQLFWALITKPNTVTNATKLSRVLDLINFIFFAALPTEINKLAFDNLAINIHASPELITKLDDFFRSYKTYTTTDSETLFKTSTHIPWYSIHLRATEKQTYRDLWLNKFKSFGIAMLADDLLEIRPHTDSQGRPKDFNDASNILDITLDDLVSAYLMLTANNEKAEPLDKNAANLMGAIFANMPPTKTGVDAYLIKYEQDTIQVLQQDVSPRSRILTSYLQSLIWVYTQAYAKKTSHNLAPINPSDEQLKESLSQYSLSPISAADIKSFRESIQRGAKLAERLLVNGEKIEIALDQKTSMKEYVRSVVDLNNFFYTLAIFNRDNGVGPATVTFQIVGNEPFKNFIYGYLNVLEDYEFNIGTEKNMFGANPFAYYRKQSHHFEKAWGLEIRWLVKDFNAEVTQEPQPYLFPARWQDIMTSPSVFGPQFHLLVGTDPDFATRLFFKWEEHGLGVDLDGLGVNLLGHAKDFGLSVARKQPFTRDLFGLTPDDAPQNNKERVPSIIAKTISEMLKNQTIQPDKMLQDKAKKGIATLYRYCKEANIYELVKILQHFFDHTNIRWGNEIVIEPGRDDSILWIDYFTTTDTKHKALYEKFSLLKREIIALATAAISTQEQGSTIEIEMPSVEKIKILMSDVLLKIEGTKETLNSSVKKYLDLISPILTTMEKLEEEDFTEFVHEYGRIMFDTTFSNSINTKFDDYDYVE